MTDERDQYHHGDLKNALIQAGIDILAADGLPALTLRSVARKAGVSHAAPYAHFAHKQALIAAISTAGYHRLYERLSAAATRFEQAPLQRLIETSWAYMSFALDHTAHFKITFSAIVEKAGDYPDFIDISRRNLELVEEIVKDCQDAGVLAPGPSDTLAVTVWALVHGLVSLVLEQQVPGSVLERQTLRETLIFALDEITTVPIPPDLAAD
jgi:AcrR family transcriptional regulator